MKLQIYLTLENVIKLMLRYYLLYKMIKLKELYKKSRVSNKRVSNLL